ncbi:gliding motility lipoprotein GldH [Marinigracilibium pacificum]|uniref:Gliding motility lipoprotein GldH n=1 Tax=Marinigracilibium pacificum TaxID=2729599 RepID=A0A848IZX9_9BACT|nr:gliding motility lipoprotein GldH [Marinigracilibium pacificum]NMM48835.1 gliding motility lipoprotein GldH [Marinigracilibium pacificum]
MRKSFFIIIPVFLLFLCACDTNRVFEQYNDFDNSTWMRNDPVNFEFNITDAEASYNLYFNIRNTADYPFHNLYLGAEIKNNNGEILIENEALLNKPEEIMIFDRKSGIPIGESSIGDIYTLQAPFKKGFQFPDTGTYKVVITHFMREQELKGIQSTGFRVEKTK